MKISKPSGRTLHFNALYNKLSEEEGSNDPEEQFDLIRFDSLKIYNQSESMEDVYEAETENMDGVSKVVLFYLGNKKQPQIQGQQQNPKYQIWILRLRL